MTRCQRQDNKKTVLIMRTIQTKPDYIKIDLIVNTLFRLDTRFALTLIFN